jgi:hypothetical protein
MKCFWLANSCLVKLWSKEVHRKAVELEETHTNIWLRQPLNGTFKVSSTARLEVNWSHRVYSTMQIAVDVKHHHYHKEHCSLRSWYTSLEGIFNLQSSCDVHGKPINHIHLKFCSTRLRRNTWDCTTYFRSVTGGRKVARTMKTKRALSTPRAILAEQQNADSLMCTFMLKQHVTSTTLLLVFLPPPATRVIPLSFNCIQREYKLSLRCSSGFPKPSSHISSQRHRVVSGCNHASTLLAMNFSSNHPRHFSSLVLL